jgi:hypothetical protein
MEMLESTALFLQIAPQTTRNRWIASLEREIVSAQKRLENYQEVHKGHPHMYSFLAGCKEDTKRLKADAEWIKSLPV